MPNYFRKVVETESNPLIGLECVSLVLLQLTGVSLCGVCIFIAVTTYDFRSLITEEVSQMGSDC